MKCKEAIIHESDNVQELTGIGEEILTDKLGNPIAKFYDGNRERPISTIGQEEIETV